VIVLDCAQTDKVTFSASSSYVGLLKATVYAGEVSAPEMRDVVETGDAAYRLITGITDKFYTVTGLNPESTYSYKVKALYTDGAVSEWSNVEEVTLFENGPAPHEFELGDVNHDRQINVTDVTTLIAMILQSDDTLGCRICGDMTGEGDLNVTDVTTLIAKILNQ
jgi:chitodextrinase